MAPPLATELYLKARLTKEPEVFGFRIFFRSPVESSRLNRFFFFPRSPQQTEVRFSRADFLPFQCSLQYECHRSSHPPLTLGTVEGTLPALPSRTSLSFSVYVPTRSPELPRALVFPFPLCRIVRHITRGPWHLQTRWGLIVF